MTAVKINKAFDCFVQDLCPRNRQVLMKSIKDEFIELSDNELEKLVSTVQLFAGLVEVFDLMNVKMMLEKMGAAITHSQFKIYMTELKLGDAKRLTFYQFLQVLRKARFDEHGEEHAEASAINVSAVGVKGAAKFFEAKYMQAANFNGEKTRTKRSQAKAEMQRCLQRDRFMSLKNTFETQDLARIGTNENSEPASADVKRLRNFFEAKR